MPTRRGFTLLEMAVMLFGGAVLGTLILPAVTLARRSAQQNICRANMGMLLRGGVNYATDYKDALPSIKGRADDEIREHRFPDLPTTFAPDPDGEIAAVATRAAIILRSRSGLPVGPPTGAHIAGSFHNLMLAEYWALKLPSRTQACPSDESLLSWQLHPASFNRQGVPSPVPADRAPKPEELAWAFSSSYHTVPATWTPDRADGARGVWRFDGAWKYTRVGAGTLPVIVTRRLSEVAFPSFKVWQHENADRHKAPKPLWWGLPDARVSVGMMDGSVQLRLTAEANPGCDPLDPAPGSPPFTYDYTPQPWMPGVGPGAAVPIRKLAGRYATTRMGLQGIDFGGNEPAPQAR